MTPRPPARGGKRVAQSRETDRLEGIGRPEPGADTVPASRKSISLAKTMRPGLLAVVPRRDLFTRIEDGVGRGAVWVAGPPGSGKTTLVSSYLEQHRRRHLWYQVDRGDVDAATFFHYMGLAASREPVLAAGGLPAFSPGRDVIAFAREYFRELYGRLPSPFALVFDNYQEAPPQSPLTLIVNTALEEIPRGGAVFVISRAEPPRELARLRANQRLELIGWSDLRLSPGELRDMAKARGQTLSERACRSLHERIQGWAAGAVLMLEHAKLMGTEAELPLGDTPQVIFDYVAGEIFEKFEAATREFLLSTACMSQLTPETATKVSGHSKAGSLLANLARNDYFVSERLVDGDRVYQFHRLLSTFLRTRARQTFAEKAWQRLVERSARLLAEAGQIDEAVSLLLDEGHWAQATEVIVANAAEILTQRRAETLTGWLDALPPSAAANPWALYWQGESRRSTAPRAARRFFELAYEGFREASPAVTEGMVLACCGSIDTIALDLDDLSLLDRWTDALEALWPDQTDAIAEQTACRAARSMLVALLLRRPGGEGFARRLEDVLSLLQRSPDAARLSGLAPVTALALMWMGRYAQAARWTDDLRGPSMARAPMYDDPGWLEWARIAQALCEGLLIGAGRPRDAAGVDAGREESPPLLRAIVCLNAGALAEADTALHEASADAAPPKRLARALHHYLRAWCAMCRDERIEAYQHGQAALGIATEVGNPGFEGLCRLAWAEILAACGDLRRAEAQAHRAEDTLSGLGNPMLELMTRLTLARVALDGESRERGSGALAEALSLGRRHGLTHTLWWRPESMAELCGLALGEGIETDYVRHLIRSRGLAPHESMADLRAWPWPLQIFTLGKFRLLVEGSTQSTVSRGSKRPLELLKALVAMGGRDVRVEHLSDLLWPHKDGDYAYGSLTSALHRLRRLLGVDDAVVLQEGRLSLNPRHVWLDTWALERALAGDVRGTAITRSGGAMVATAERVLELYRGAFLEDEFESTSYIALREHLRGKVLRLLNRIARQATRSPEVETAVGLFEHAIDADPLCEDFYRGLLTLYDAHDMRADALDVYNRCRSMLTASLGTAPSTEMTALYEKLRSETSSGQSPAQRKPDMP